VYRVIADTLALLAFWTQAPAANERLAAGITLDEVARAG
jgi:hypothetical protein